jgi:hypothetical protein
MYENTFVQDKTKAASDKARPALAELRATQALVKKGRAQGFVALNKLFRSGRVPEPALNGRYAGELIALDIAPGLTQFYEWLTDRWLPWLGKSFNAAQGAGDNIFTRDSYALTRLFNPFYRGFVADASKTYRAFAFRTYVAPGLADPDLMVLKIDYNLDTNPSLTIRRVLDELVQLDEHLYLGKAHVRWWFGGRQMVAYFSLTDESPSSGLIAPFRE